MRVGVPVSSGMDMALALAKLRVVELHDNAAMARLSGHQFDPGDEDNERVFDNYIAFIDGECDGPDQWFLAGRCDMEVSDVCYAKTSVGYFARDVRVCSSRPVAESATDDLTVAAVEELANVCGFELPWGWQRRVNALVRKHAPPATSATQANANWSRKRCACGNIASRGVECNACYATRATRSPSDGAGKSPSEKRARTDDEGSSSDS